MMIQRKLVLEIFFTETDFMIFVLPKMLPNIMASSDFLQLIYQIQLLSVSSLFVIFIMCWFQTTVEIIVFDENTKQQNTIDKSEVLAGVYRKKSTKIGYCLSQEKSNNNLNFFYFKNNLSYSIQIKSAVGI